MSAPGRDAALRPIGIVGGIGPESTIDYYRSILAAARERGIDAAPSIVIHSIDVTRLLALAGAGRVDELARYLLDSVDALARAGAKVALFAANTPHLVFDEVAARASIPLVSIVAATCDAAERQGLRRLGLVGTRFTMEGRFYPAVFEARGLSIVVPSDDDLAYVHDTYVGELVAGVFTETARHGVAAVLDRMRQRDGIDGVILGGTELPLLLRGLDTPMPLLDTTRIHVAAVVALAAH